MTEVQDTFLSEYFEDTQQAKHCTHPDENEIAVKSIKKLILSEDQNWTLW